MRSTHAMISSQNTPYTTPCRTHREVIVRLCPPGTFRTLLLSSWRAMARRVALALRRCSDGAALVAAEGDADELGGAHQPLPSGEGDPFVPRGRDWWVDERDLEQFRASCERAPGPEEPAWEAVLRKEWDGCTYVAERRARPGGLSGTEYRSTTLVRGASAEAVMDFYLDDDVRAVWDAMITQHSLVSSLPARPGQERCQVVRWLRTFPLSVVSSREYLLARRVLRAAPEGAAPGAPEALYAVTRAIDHPAVPHRPGVVRMEDAYSMWRSRDVEWPGEPGCPAAETVLLHFEDLKIAENVARFAVRHGMQSFIKRMLPEQRAFLDRRALRGIDPRDVDPASYGFRQAACRVDGERAGTLGDEAACRLSPASSGSLDNNSLETESTLSGRSTRSLPSARRLTTMVLASSIAIFLARSGARSSSGASARGPLRRRRRARSVKDADSAFDPDEDVALSPSASALSLAGLDGAPSASKHGARLRLARLSARGKQPTAVPLSDGDLSS